MPKFEYNAYISGVVVLVSEIGGLDAEILGTKTFLISILLIMRQSTGKGLTSVLEMGITRVH